MRFHGPLTPEQTLKLAYGYAHNWYGQLGGRIDDVVQEAMAFYLPSAHPTNPGYQIRSIQLAVKKIVSRRLYIRPGTSKKHGYIDAMDGMNRLESTRSLDSLATADDPDGETVGGLLPDPITPHTEVTEARQMVVELLSHLSPTEQVVVYRAYGLEDSSREIAHDMGVSKSTLEKIRFGAMHKLRAMVGLTGPLRADHA